MCLSIEYDSSEAAAVVQPRQDELECRSKPNLYSLAGNINTIAIYVSKISDGAKQCHHKQRFCLAQIEQAERHFWNDIIVLLGYNEI